MFFGAFDLYTENLSPIEAMMAYPSYIKATLYYALPIMVFSFEECGKLNKIIYNNILPKCGLNWHTPRALIFAPTKIGGFNFDHIWTKQLILHLELFLRHLWRDDTLGKSILCNLNCYQLLIGRSVPFFSLNPTIHNYVDLDGCIGMIWSALYLLNIHWVIPKLSIISSSYD